MIVIALAFLSAAVVVGSGLAIPFMREAATKRPPWAVPLAHGALGSAGLVALVAALRRGVAPGGMGTDMFAPLAAWLIGAALALGLVLGVVGSRRRPHGAVVGAHASLAVAGYVLLLALLTAGS